MELVYLWVEDYKNIHNQGFNFSPRFTCAYNQEINELTINENDDYIKDFFGEHINVTAIVGKNGSGKSSIIKLILMSIYDYKFKYLGRDDKFISLETFDRMAYKNKNYIENKFQNKLFLILTYHNKLQKISIGFNSILASDIPEIDNIDFFSIYYNYMLDTLHDGSIEDSWINKSYHGVNEYNSSILLEPQKIDGNDEKVDLELLEYITSQKLATLYKLNLHNSFIEKYFNPNKIKLCINKIKLKLKFKLLGTSTYGNPMKQHDGTFKHNGKIFHDFNFKDIENKFNIFLKDISLNDINNLYIGFKLLEHNHLMVKDEFILLRKSFIDSFNTNEVFESFFQKINTYDIKKSSFFKNQVKGFEKQKLLNAFNFRDKILMNSNYKIKLENNLNTIIPIDIMQDIILYIPPWIDVDYFENEKSYKSLSSGEKSFINFIMSLLYQINNLKDTEYKSINIFLDEVELGFHPEWQKKYLSSILSALRDSTLKINLYFLSHSPFILSDIPKQNIIFLDKDEKGNCKVVDGLKEKKQTFGANIHTLLSDSFFMEDGLMGEFAKGKIDEAIKLLNSPNKLSDKEFKYCEEIISIIGEPIIKSQLQRKLDSKKINYIAKDINEEIELLKHRIDLLSKRL